MLPLRRFLDRMRSHISRYDVLVAFLSGIIFAFFTYALWIKYSHFGYYDWDFALYAHALWNLSQGSFYSSLWGTNFLTNHAEYLALLLAPFYALFPHPFVLILLKIFSVVGGGFVFYLIAKKIIGHRLSLFLMIVYLFYPPNLFMLLYEFHFENLAPFFLFLLFYFYSQGQKKSFVLCAILAALIKENIALVVATFGILALFSKKNDKRFWISAPIAIGGTIFTVSMFLITPALRSHYQIASANQYIGMYLQIPGNASFFDLLTINLRYLWTNINTPLTLQYLKTLFLPLNILPFLSPGIFLLNGILFLQHLLSSEWHMKTIYFHYAATLLPFIFIATAHTLKKLKNFCRPWIFNMILLFLFMGCTFNILRLRDNSRFLFMSSGWRDPLDPFRKKIISRIPPQAPVITTFEFLPELSQRPGLHAFYKIWMNQERFSHQTKAAIPPDVHYAIFDFDDPWLWGDSLIGVDNENIRIMFQRLTDVFLESPWQATLAADDLVLFEKNNRRGIPLLEVKKNAFPQPANALTVWIDKNISLNVPEPPITTANATLCLPLTFYWQAVNDIQTIYRLEIFITSGDPHSKKRKVVSHYVGYGIYPTIMWKKGDLVQEQFNLFIGDLPDGKYRITVQVLDYLNDRWAGLTLNEKVIDDYPLGEFWIPHNAIKGKKK